MSTFEGVLTCYVFPYLRTVYLDIVPCHIVVYCTQEVIKHAYIQSCEVGSYNNFGAGHKHIYLLLSEETYADLMVTFIHYFS